MIIQILNINLKVEVAAVPLCISFLAYFTWWQEHLRKVEMNDWQV